MCKMVNKRGGLTLVEKSAEKLADRHGILFLNILNEV